MVDFSKDLTEAQDELYIWIKDYMRDFQHSPSIRQMMEAMGLKSPAPIQSRLKHLQEKGYISWQEGKARTLQLIDEVIESKRSRIFEQAENRMHAQQALLSCLIS